jgi:opacity protein-like surface antigen
MRKVIARISILFILLWASPGRGEWYADLYGGVIFDGRVDQTHLSSIGTMTSEVELRPAFTGGVRGGYWFESLPFGIGLDLFFLRADTKAESVVGTINGTPATVQAAASQMMAAAIAFELLRLRFPLFVSQRFPHGQVQPYLSAGPALFFTRFKDTGGAGAPPSQTDSDTVLGVKIGAGVTFQISRLVGVFAEYRFTHFQADVSLRNAMIPAGTDTFERVVDAHHMVGGVSFAF